MNPFADDKVSQIIRQAKKVLSLRDAAGGIPGGVSNSSDLQTLAILIQHHEADMELRRQMFAPALPGPPCPECGTKDAFHDFDCTLQDNMQGDPIGNLRRQEARRQLNQRPPVKRTGRKMSDDYAGWKGVQVRHSDGRSGEVDCESIYIDGARDLWVNIGQERPVAIRLSGSLNNWKKDESAEGWEWLCAAYADGPKWLSFSD